MPGCRHACIVASRSRCLYIGVTGDLVNRMGQHEGRLPRANGFASHYRTSQLVYYETTTDVMAALERQKQLKGWRRSRKVALITSANPGWRDLARAWPEIEPCSSPMDTSEERSPRGWLRGPSVALRASSR